MRLKNLDSIEETNIPVSIKFENLNYHVKENRSIKPILQGISGQFSSGELTAILGASGSGKTALLNILSGYVKENVTGTIKLNEEVCDGKLLRKLSAYVMQRDLLQPHLTPEEQLMIVAKLKLPKSLEGKKLIVDELIDTFNLRNCCGTRLEKLSGGEKKRLSIALELISNPSVIFLDEPTSGLDSVAVELCLSIFRQLSNSGKTVIFTIHQPSVAIMNQFDQVYFLARGTCIYNGSTENILPFLTELNLNCPITSSYSEFVIETVETNPETIQLLSDSIENGKVNNRKADPTISDSMGYRKSISRSHTSFWTEFIVIFHRMMVQQWRNKVGLVIQLFTYVLVGLLAGITFFGVGSSAKNLVSNVYVCWGCNMVFMYNSVMTYVTVYPIEMEILKREYLNRWYSLRAYYLALSIRSLPITVIAGTLLVTEVYLLSDQPQELERFLRFNLVGLLLIIISEGYGLAIGCAFGTLGGTILAPGLIGIMAIIPLYGFGFGDAITLTAKIIMRISYLRFGFIAMIYALMEDRPPMHCSDLFCLYTDPKDLLRDLGVANNSYSFEIFGLMAYGLFFRIIAYLVLKFRMQQELTSKNSDHFSKLLQIKN